MMTADNLQIYRKRFLPPENILLKDDQIVKQTEDIIVTKWKTLKPKAAFDHGCSCYYLNRGFKVSKYICADGSLLYWYCDIVEYSYEESDNTLTVTDLLADVILYPDGQLKVMDLDELAEALEQATLPQELAVNALRLLNDLLTLIYNDQFASLTEPLKSLT